MKHASSTLERQAAAAKLRADAKAQEFASHILVADKRRAQQARDEAVAFFESHLDLTAEAIDRLVGR